MATNPDNLYTILDLYFRRYEQCKFNSKQRLKAKFANLKQKAKSKIIGENLEKTRNVGLSTEEIIPSANANILRDDYFEKLKKIYKLKKEKVNHNLKNFKMFYQKRLDEKESTKMLKTVTKWSLLSSFCLVNVAYFYKMKKARFWFLSVTLTSFLCLNVFLQYQINARYKRRIRSLLVSEGENI